MCRARIAMSVVALSALVGACRSARPEVRPAADSCTEGGADLTPRSTAAGLAGSYRLSLAATSGPRAGAAAEGALVLRPPDDSAASSVLVLGLADTSVSHPMAGTLDLDRQAIGAVSTGDLASSDPSAPGVLVIERRPLGPGAAVEITMRLGADANRRSQVRFDGGYFALTVRRLGANGFAGTWASGGAGDGASGSLCARRASP